MDDLISRQAAIDAIKGLEFCHYMEFGEYIGEDTREVRLIRAEKAQDTLQKLPSAQPERKKGKWIDRTVDFDAKKSIEEWQSAKCSVCGLYHTTPYLYYFDDFNFCPNCGAKMEERE